MLDMALQDIAASNRYQAWLQGLGSVVNVGGEGRAYLRA